MLYSIHLVFVVALTVLALYLCGPMGHKSAIFNVYNWQMWTDLIIIFLLLHFRRIVEEKIACNLHLNMMAYEI